MAQRGLRGLGGRLQRLGALALLRQRDEGVLHVLERAHNAVLGAQQRLTLAALGDLVDRARAPGVENRHREQTGHVGEAGGTEIDAIQLQALAPVGCTEEQPREPLGRGLLAARIGRFELRHQRKHVRPALQQGGGLPLPGLGHRHVATRRLDARGVEGLVADQHRDAVPRHSSQRLQRGDLRARRCGIGLRALDVEGGCQPYTLARADQAQCLVLRRRDRAQCLHLAQRADQREVVAGDVAHHQQAHAAYAVLRSQRLGLRCICAGA
ncbi:hypothetical protein D3C78_1124280 [compost metagenome]